VKSHLLPLIILFSLFSCFLLLKEPFTLAPLFLHFYSSISLFPLLLFSPTSSLILLLFSFLLLFSSLSFAGLSSLPFWYLLLLLLLPLLLVLLILLLGAFL